MEYCNTSSLLVSHQPGKVDALVAPAFIPRGDYRFICLADQTTRKKWKKGNIDVARSIQERLMPLHNALFLETSPAPVKYAASLLDICNSEVRLPLVEPLQETKNKLRDALEKLQLISKKI